MKALITGITGFVGEHLSDYLQDKGHQVFGIDKNEKELKGAIIYKADILDKKKINSIISKIKPDYIFHLAAISSVVNSFKIPDTTMKINVEGTKNILDTILVSNIDSRILIVTSPHVYGIPKQSPITEEHILQPNSPYAKSRVEQEKLCFEYQKKYDMNIIISRSFNHTGPGRPPEFVCSDFAKQIVDIEKGIIKQKVIKTGDLSIRRDFFDVRDIVKAYLLAVEKCIPGQIYNICSGNDYSIKDILDILLSMSYAKIKIIQDQTKIRSSDIPVIIGNCSKFKEQTGWKPKISFEKTLKDLLNYWRCKL
ncbi:NAD-dependent epimerase/dehydratase family protein [Candidatus Woesearchaeota archaeon]|nr:NAD-dependent epimerase/dehydratase family protein [Candidatus Woesearchaeota archaeon]